MKRCNILGLILATGFLAAGATDLTLRNTPVEVYFSPHGGCAEAIIGVIDTAQKEVLVQSYSFTSIPLATALKRAHDRGVRVMVILDKSQETERFSELSFLVRAGIPVWIDPIHPISHNKLVLADGRVTITGSYNHTKSAEFNAENLLVIHNQELTGCYMANWEVHRKHSYIVN